METQLPLINHTTLLKTPTIIMIDECCCICESVLMDAAPAFSLCFFSKNQLGFVFVVRVSTCCCCCIWMSINDLSLSPASTHNWWVGDKRTWVPHFPLLFFHLMSFNVGKCIYFFYVCRGSEVQVQHELFTARWQLATLCSFQHHQVTTSTPSCTTSTVQLNIRSVGTS